MFSKIKNNSAKCLNQIPNAFWYILMIGYQKQFCLVNFLMFNQLCEDKKKTKK